MNIDQEAGHGSVCRSELMHDISVVTVFVVFLITFNTQLKQANAHLFLLAQFAGIKLGYFL